MTTTITWRIVQLDRNSADGGVNTAHWRAEAVDGQLSSSLYGAIGFTPDPTAAGFTPYEQLTEAQVLEWVWRALAAQKADAEEDQQGAYMTKEEIEDGLTRHIELQKAPATASGTPW